MVLEEELEKGSTSATKARHTYNYETEIMTGILEKKLTWESLKKWRRDSS